MTDIEVIDMFGNIAKCLVSKKTRAFAAGLLFGTAGISLLSSKDAKNAYTHCTAAVLRAKKKVVQKATTLQENCEDIYEGAVIPESEQEKFAALPDSFSHLYLSIDGRLKAVICIEDPVRQEAAGVISDLRDAGFTNIVMMTGDNKHIAERIAGITGVDRFYAEVLPEDKAGFVEQERAAGHTVVMVGDGINDSPALSAADVGIAISDGAEIAREIADITVSGGDISDIVIARRISASLIKRINFNYRFIVSFNTALIVLGVLGIISPTTSALLHNGSTLAIGLKSLTNVEY